MCLGSPAPGWIALSFRGMFRGMPVRRGERTPMARTVTPLTDPKCEAAKPREKDYKLSDGQGLYLLVKPSGVKTWRLKFVRPDGREGLATFGNYPSLGLKAARDRRAEALELLARGIDPVEAARATKIDEAIARTNTFEALALEWHFFSTCHSIAL